MLILGIIVPERTGKAHARNAAARIPDALAEHLAACQGSFV